ncbi:hypothetical protein J8J40_21565, partial [Mycobacterium tuberculosis]|nr:hypothetical protein [Mycobacterium tuberculosis]
MCDRAAGRRAFQRREKAVEPGVRHVDEEEVRRGGRDLPVELAAVADYSPGGFDPDDAESGPGHPLAEAPERGHVDLDPGEGRK